MITFIRQVLQIRAIESKYYIKWEKKNNLNTILQLLTTTHLPARMYPKKEQRTHKQQRDENMLEIYNGSKVYKGTLSNNQQSHICIHVILTQFIHINHTSILSHDYQHNHSITYVNYGRNELITKTLHACSTIMDNTCPSRSWIPTLEPEHTNSLLTPLVTLHRFPSRTNYSLLNPHHQIRARQNWTEVCTPWHMIFNNMKYHKNYHHTITTSKHNIILSTQELINVT